MQVSELSLQQRWAKLLAQDPSCTVYWDLQVPKRWVQLIETGNQSFPLIYGGFFCVHMLGLLGFPCNEVWLLCMSWGHIKK